MSIENELSEMKKALKSRIEFLLKESHRTKGVSESLYREAIFMKTLLGDYGVDRPKQKEEADQY